MSRCEKQLIVIEKLVMGCNHQEAADAAGVARSTVYRWLNEEEFKRGLDSARESIKEGHEQVMDSYKRALG